jgi:hypothetical protein
VTVSTPTTATTRAVARLVAPLILLLALAGCAGTAGDGTAAASSTPTATTSAGPCADVTVIVDFGTLSAPSIKKCASDGLASDVLKSAKITTVGTADYGDAVVCRVDNLPKPADESCAKLPAAAYWALWIKDKGGDWAYADNGVTTQQVTAGQSLGLVYTVGDASTPPQG